VGSGRLTFPLVPRRGVIGISFGAMRSLRRGAGTDIAGSRPYRPGDDMDAIDWAASARLSTARGADEFIVRERFAEEAPRVVVICDRRPAMSCFASPLPWLDKPLAMRNLFELILASAAGAGGFVGYLDQADGETFWRPPQLERRLVKLRNERLESSDFVPMPSNTVWFTAIENRWDVVPVVIQDPTWDQSFPDIAGIAVPLRDAESGRTIHVRLKRDEIAVRRSANEERIANLLSRFQELDLDPILVSSSEPSEILSSFLEWAELRRVRRVVQA
jgi:hypothetical protein